MTILRYEGTVSFDKYIYHRVYIGGVDILDKIAYGPVFNGPVTVAFADERFSGDLEADTGARGYGEWTPGDAAIFNIGEHYILDRLEEYEGKQIVLWIADEPINTLDPPPSWANKE